MQDLNETLAVRHWFRDALVSIPPKGWDCSCWRPGHWRWDGSSPGGNHWEYCVLMHDCMYSCTPLHISILLYFQCFKASVEGLGTVDILFGTYYTARMLGQPEASLWQLQDLLNESAARQLSATEVVPATIEGSTQAQNLLQSSDIVPF